MTDEAEMELDLDEERDKLREDLIILSGDLKKFGYDFTDTVRPLLIDTAPATAETNRRLKRRYDSMKEKLDNIRKETAPPPPPPSRPALPRQNGRAAPATQQQIAANGELLPRLGLFPMFFKMKQTTYKELEETLLWAFHVITSNLETHVQSPKWMEDHWNCNGPTTQGPLLQTPPCDFQRYRFFTTNGYISAPNLFQAARAGNLHAIETGRVKHSNTSHKSATATGHQQQFTRWALQQVVSNMHAQPTSRLSYFDLCKMFDALPDNEQSRITPHHPEQYFVARHGFRLSMDYLYDLAKKKGDSGSAFGSDTAADNSDNHNSDNQDSEIAPSIGHGRGRGRGRESGRGREHGRGRGRGRGRETPTGMRLSGVSVDLARKLFLAI